MRRIKEREKGGKEHKEEWSRQKIMVGDVRSRRNEEWRRDERGKMRGS